MPDDDGRRSPLDELVERAIGLLGPLGLNVTQLRWRFRRYRSRVEEQRREAANRMRGVTGAHRMCRSCRALVPAGARTCSECGAPLAGGPAPGPARLLQWLLPGISPVTAGVITANFALFILIAARAGFSKSGSGIFDLLSFDGEVLFRYGAGSNFRLYYTGSLLHFLREDWWRLITPMFLHHGLVHLLFNCYILVQLGALMEDEYGPDRFFVLYFLSGVGGWVASEILRYYLFGGLVLTVGASGAVMGLVGAALVTGIRRGGAYGAALRASMTRFLLTMLVMSLLMARMMDHFAHVGGLAGGAAFAALLPARASDREAQAALWRVAALASVALTVVALLFAGWKGMADLQQFG